MRGGEPVDGVSRRDETEAAVERIGRSIVVPGRERAPAGARTQAVVAAGVVKTSDPIEDGYGLAKALRLAGDANQRLGNSSAARANWTRALAVIPRTTSERPSEMSDQIPPILGSWRNLYAAVLIALAAEVVVFYVLTRVLA